jgi:small-conductance mechanosensitive channel
LIADRLPAWLAGPWQETLLAALVAMALAWALGAVFERILRTLSRGAPQSQAVLAAIRRPAMALLPLLALHAVLHGADDTLRFVGAARQTNLVLLIICVTWILANAIRGFGRAVLLRYPMDVEDNLEARRIHTQTRLLARTAIAVVSLIGLGVALMTFPGVRQVGASLLASAGVAGLVAGIAARPVIGNLIAGLQIALTQPIRIDDVLIVNNEWGRVEEITSAFVVMRIWDERRLIIPLQFFIENPFQNWTRASAEIMGSVFLWVDYRMPLQPLRDAARRACEANPKWWDGRVCLLQVTESGERAVQLRVILTSANSPDNWDLRCAVREALVTLMQTEYPQYLPRLRGEWDTPAGTASGAQAGPHPPAKAEAPKPAWPPSPREAFQPVRPTPGS